MADAGAGHETETFPDSNETADVYDVYDNGQDLGVQMSDAMVKWFNEGFVDGTGKVIIEPCEAFVRIQPAHVDAAMAQFGSILCGVNLTDDADQRFDEHQPWTVADGQTPDPNKGHVTGRVKSDGTMHTYVSWGDYVLATVAWSDACVEEAWAPLTLEMAHNLNMNVPALLAAIKAMGGEVRQPTPTPAPTPKPVPSVPVPDDALVSKVKREAEEIAHDVEEIVEDVAHSV
jgi:hypothetical protein